MFYINPKVYSRYSGDYSMSSSTTSISRKQPIQPRYLDISKYKNEQSPKNFLRRDPSKTYVGVLGDNKTVSKGSAQHYEMGKRDSIHLLFSFKLEKRKSFNICQKLINCVFRISHLVFCSKLGRTRNHTAHINTYRITDRHYRINSLG